MSSADRLLLILHIGFAIFALGPVTAATMSTPRYIRRADTRVVRLLNRLTRVYGLLTLAVFLLGLPLAHGRFDRMWLTASMTLFVVAIVLLLIVERDQRKALHRLEAAEATVAGVAAEAERRPPPGAEEAGEPEEPPAPAETAKVERGRIATISGVVALIWIVILVLMVWNG